MKVFLFCVLFVNVFVGSTTAKKCFPVTTPAPTTETSTTTTKTTTTPTPPPTLPLNTTGCTNIYKVYTSTNAYLKTLCHVKQTMNSAKANTFCTSNGMELYELVDQASFEGYKRFINTYYPSNFGPSFIGNGYKQADKWVLFSKQNVPLYSGLLFTASASTSDCMRFTRIGTDVNDFKGDPALCSTGSYFSCQFYENK